MKMGTTASPWRYDAAACETIRPDWQRRTTILRYASWAAAFPISLVVRLPFDSGPFDQSRDRRDGPNPDLLAIRAADRIGRLLLAQIAAGWSHPVDNLFVRLFQRDP
jgi:hypothetical protein